MRTPEIVDSRALVFRRWSRGTKLWGQGKAKRSSAHDWRETGRRDEIEDVFRRQGVLTIWPKNPEISV